MKARINSSSGILPQVTENEDTQRILFLIEALRTLFYNHFDKGWFLNLLEKMSFSSSVLRQIRQMIQLHDLYERDTHILEAGVEALEEFVHFARVSIQPVIRDELGVSGFSCEQSNITDSGSAVIRGFFVYAFPHNLDRLEDLTLQLKPLVRKLSSEMPPLYSSIPHAYHAADSEYAANGVTSRRRGS